MPNYSLIINSSFKPFSYQDFLAPTLMATQAHQELENQYGELAAKANVWEEMANEQTDPYAYKMYKTYANDLEEQAGQLAREGLNAASRRDMLNMRARYSKEITPIEQAYTARQKQAEQQQQALLQDPTLMLSRRAATTSLDDYIRNPQLAYESYSGKLITAQAASAASALAKEMQEKPRKWRNILGNSYYETMMQKGFSSQAVLQAIQDNPNAAPQLTRIVEDAINSSGVRDWGDQATIARAIDYAKQGLWSAVGETQYQTLDNWRAKMAAQEAMQIRAERRAATREQENAANIPITLAPRILEGAEGTVNKDLDRLKGFRLAGKQSFSTDANEKAYKRLETAKKNLSTLTKNDWKEIKDYQKAMTIAKSRASGAGGSAYSKLGASMSVPKPVAYTKYEKLQKEYNEAFRAYRAEQAFMTDIYNKYKHLGKNMYTAVKRGIELDKLHQKQESSSFALNAKDSDYNNIVGGLSRVLNSFTEDNVNAGNVGLVDRKSGKAISYSKMQDLIGGDNAKNVSIKVKGGKNPELVLVAKGKEYNIKGVSQVSSFNKDMQVVNDYLQDFSALGVRGTKTTYNNVVNILNSGTLSTTVTTPIKGSRYRGAALTTPEGEIIKVMTDNNGRIVATNTLSGELQGGQMRDQYFMNMANQGLTGLTNLFAK